MQVFLEKWGQFSYHSGVMVSRLGAGIEHVLSDRVSNPNEYKSILGTVHNAAGDYATKIYDVISNAAPSVLGIFSSKEYEVRQRDGIMSATRASLERTLNAQWVKSEPGRIINIIPKVINGFLEIPDGLIRDGIHIVGGGGRNDGTIVATSGANT